MALNTLSDVFLEQIEDLYSAETQLVEALPRVAAAASDEKLRAALEEHLEQTRGHVARLTEVFGKIGGQPMSSEKCEGMAGLLREGEHIIGMPGSGPAKDAAIIGAAQRVEHYEIAAYGTARTLAQELGYDEARSILDDTLDEESAADEMLTKIATGGLLRSGVNAEAKTV